jgi:phosphotransferase system IIA component
VTAGEPLSAFDKKKIERAGFKDIVIIVILNSSDFPHLHAVYLRSINVEKLFFHIE